MKENKKTLIIITIMIVTMLSCGLFYNIVKANGVGSNENADIKNGNPYDVSRGILAEFGLFRRRWSRRMGYIYC